MTKEEVIVEMNKRKALNDKITESEKKGKQKENRVRKSATYRGSDAEVKT